MKKPWAFAETEYLKARLSLGDAIEDIAPHLPNRTKSAIRSKAIAEGWLQLDDAPHLVAHRAFVARNMEAARAFRDRMKAEREAAA